jgi:hypothetical protein
LLNRQPPLPIGLRENIKRFFRVDTLHLTLSLP